MRTPPSASSWWKRTVLRWTALYSLTGTVTRPKEMAPVQIERGMDYLVCPIGTGGPASCSAACVSGYEDDAPAPAFSRTSCSPSANSSTILSLKAGRSSGLRLVTRPWSTTTSSSTHLPPALRMSVLIDGYEVTVRPLTASASTSTHGPWQI